MAKRNLTRPSDVALPEDHTDTIFDLIEAEFRKEGVTFDRKSVREDELVVRVTIQGKYPDADIKEVCDEYKQSWDSVSVLVNYANSSTKPVTTTFTFKVNKFRIL